MEMTRNAITKIIVKTKQHRCCKDNTSWFYSSATSSSHYELGFILMQPEAATTSLVLF